jgi:type II secretory pathway pseudopilin PulG
VAIVVAIMLLCGGVLAAILVPSLSRARAAAQEARLGANARQIVTAVVMYAAGSNDEAPPHLAATITLGALDPEALRDKRFNRPAMAMPPAGADWRSIRADVDAHSDFVYLGEGLKLNKLSSPQDCPVVYAKDPLSKGEILTGFADGHVEKLPPARFSAAFADLNSERASQSLPPLPAP